MYVKMYSHHTLTQLFVIILHIMTLMVDILGSKTRPNSEAVHEVFGKIHADY
jgi:hypothetical protein